MPFRWNLAIFFTYLHDACMKEMSIYSLQSISVQPISKHISRIFTLLFILTLSINSNISFQIMFKQI